MFVLFAGISLAKTPAASRVSLKSFTLSLLFNVLHSAIFQIVANNFLEVLLRSYWHVAVFVILTDNYKIPLIVIQHDPSLQLPNETKHCSDHKDSQ